MVSLLRSHDVDTVVCEGAVDEDLLLHLSTCGILCLQHVGSAQGHAIASCLSCRLIVDVRRFSDADVAQIDNLWMLIGGPREPENSAFTQPSDMMESKFARCRFLCLEVSTSKESTVYLCDTTANMLQLKKRRMEKLMARFFEAKRVSGYNCSFFPSFVCV